MASNPQSSKGPVPRKPRDKSASRAGNHATAGMMNDLLNTLECPICMEILKAPIFLCATGHNICGMCKNKLHMPQCPICRSNISGQRNFSLEEISSKILSPCPHASFGCEYKETSEKLHAHIQECVYKPYFCPLGIAHKSCGWKGAFSSLKHHFLERHPKNAVLKTGCEVKFSNFDVHQADADIQLLQFAKGLLFVYHVKIDVVKNVANWAIQMIAPEKTAKGYFYEFLFYRKNSKRSLKYMEECTSNSININNVFNDGLCVSIPLNVLKNFVDEQKELTFKMFIKSEEYLSGQVKNPGPRYNNQFNSH